METPPSSSREIRGLDKFNKPQADEPAAEIRGLEKFKKPSEGAPESDEPRLSQPERVEVRGMEKFKNDFDEAHIPDEAGDAETAKPAPEANIDIQSLSLVDRVMAETPEGTYRLEFFGNGHFEVHGPDGRFVGAGKAVSLGPGEHLELALNGKHYRSGPVSAVQLVRGVRRDDAGS